MKPCNNRPTFDDVREAAARNLAPFTDGPTLRAHLSGLVVVVSLAVWLVLLVVAVMSAPGCLPPVDCTPSTSFCTSAGVPAVCSSTGRTWAVSSPAVPCSEVGGVCAMREGVAACVRPDGGVR